MATLLSTARPLCSGLACLLTTLSAYAAPQADLSNAQDSVPSKQSELRIATFNVALNRDEPEALLNELQDGDSVPIQYIAEIIQRVRPDILLLNEFDYVAGGEAVDLLQQNYLQVSQHGAQTIDYPHRFLAPVNTGQASSFDLDKDGEKTDTEGDALGYGDFPGQYGMVLLSRYPIATDKVRTFQHFLWRDMPDALLPTDPDTGKAWYSDAELAILPLSSKSHWDVPIQYPSQRLHMLASHPTPPVFDGAEDRNGRRNHDEIRFWKDYIAPQAATYIYDDTGKYGGLAAGATFVVLGDLNASPTEGDSTNNAIAQLLDNQALQGSFTPQSVGAAEHSPDNPLAIAQTASWRMRADYVIPSSTGLKIQQGGVFWPSQTDPLHYLIADKDSSSDHRLVWVDVDMDNRDSEQ